MFVKGFNRLYTKIMDNVFVRNLMTLSFGSAVAQMIPFFATMVLSRLYSPAQMGEWGVFSSYASILAILGCLRYDGAIIRAKKEVDAYNIVSLSLALALLFTFVLYLVAFLITWLDISVQLDTGAVFMLPLYVLVMLLIQILLNLSTYLRAYKLIATNSINRSLSQCAARIALGCVHINKGMVIGSVIGAITSAYTLGHKLKVLSCIKLMDTKRMLEVAKENLDFPKYDLPSNLLNSISSHCPPILLAYYYQEQTVGLFSMAYTLLYIPMSLVGSSISQLFYKNASELHNRGESIAGLTKTLFMSLYLLGVLFMIFMVFTEGWLFGFLLGEKWIAAGRFACLLSPWLLTVTAFSPISPVFYIKKKQHVNMILNLIGIIFRFTSFIVAAMLLQTSEWTIMIFAFVSTLMIILSGCFVFYISDVKLRISDKLLIIFSTIIFVVLYSWKSHSILCQIA